MVTTLREVWSEYKVRRKLRLVTIQDYDKRLRLVESWLDKPITSITKDMVQETHEALAKRGQRQASLCMRIVSALFNYAALVHEDAGIKNPVRRLSETRSWHKSTPNKQIVRDKQLSAWHEAVRKHPQRNFFLFFILTGCRRKEVVLLKWESVDLTNGVVSIPITKNGLCHVFPVSAFVLDMLRFMREENPTGVYVFPGETEAGHLSIWNKSNLDIVKQSGVSFTLHSLRRNFLTTAVGLEIPVFCIRQLVNHKTRNVTEGYYCPEADNLRRYTEAITASILEKAGLEY